MNNGRYDYDLVAIGSGPAGNSAAQQVVLRGGRACLVEHGPVGGTCLNVGCMPTKAMLAASAIAQDIRRGPQFGISAGSVNVDGRAFMARVQKVVAELLDSMQGKIDSTQRLDLVRGRGRVIDEHTVAVQRKTGDDRTIRARAIVIATGSRPVRPDFLPWETGRVLTSSELIRAETLPQSLLVMGGGPLGCEFATVFAELGIPTTIVEMADALLPPLSPSAGRAARKLLEARGATVHTGRKIEQMTEQNGALLTTMDDGTSLRTDRALVAVGREANLDDLGLETLGLQWQDHLSVDEACRTAVGTIYAGGDVADHRNHSHLADRMGVVIGDQVMGVDTRDDRTVVPMGVYTHPEIAFVGLSEKEATEQGLDVRVESSDYAHSGTGFIYDRTDGSIELVIERDSLRLLGALWIGPQAMDMIHECALAIRHDMTARDIFRTIHAHPSFQEALHVTIEELCRQKARS